jgi:hypothetical protein
MNAGPMGPAYSVISSARVPVRQGPLRDFASLSCPHSASGPSHDPPVGPNSARFASSRSGFAFRSRADGWDSNCVL